MQIKPKGLFVRFTMMIVLPIMLLITTSTYIFYQRHWDNISSKMKSILVNEVFIVVKAYSAKDFETPTRLGFFIKKTETPFNKKTRSRYSELANEISTTLGRPVSIKVRDDKDMLITIAYDHYNLEITSSLKRIESSTTALFITWLVGAALIVVLISMVFMKKQVEAIIELSEFADRLGKGQEVGIIRVYGASEIRKLARAFIKMKGRIERQIKYRTELLAHISHDLRTPLTRIKLNLALNNETPQANEINEELIYMENVIESYLNFAKEEGTETIQTFNFYDLLLDIKNRYHDKVVFAEPKRKKIIVSLRYHAVHRALVNVIDNALKHAKSMVTFATTFDHGIITINIDDDGKGIPKKFYKSVFEPFHKIDNSKDGFGLGLAIVKNIIYGHGGKIELDKSRLGGLNFKIKIPV